MPNVVGVDAGGTKTAAAFSRDGEVVRRVDGAAANPMTLGIDDAADAILRTIREACSPDHPNAIYIGAAGAASPSVARELESLISAAYSRARIRVGDDVEIALRAVVPSGPGIVLIAGTGSVALAVAADGEHHRVGGLGYLLGDEGSAAWIGLQAMRLLGNVYDGRAKADETSALVARHLAAPDREALLRVAYRERLDLARIAALAPSIIAFAGKGNRASTAIVREAAAELAALVRDAARNARLTQTAPKVVLSGGLVRDESLLVTLLEARIAGDLPGAQILRGGDPVVGAVRCAEALLL